MSKEVAQMAQFKWTKKREKAAISLANGHTQKEAGDMAGVARRTIQRWLDIPEFSEEVDRLTLMLDIASRAERLRIAKRIVRKIGDNTEKDLLDWLKYCQQETDGIHLDLTNLAIQINTINYRDGLSAVAPSEAVDWWVAAEDEKGGDA